MSSEDRLRLVDHEADSHHEGQEKLGTEPGSQAIQTGGSQVRFSSRSPQVVMANKTAPRQAHQNVLLAEAVYGDGNVFVTDEPIKRARSCNYVRAVIAILMLPLFVLLILAITGLLPIGWGTHDVPPPPPATDAQMNELKHMQQQQQQHETGHQTAPVACKKLAEQQMLNHIQDQVVEAVNGASPREVQHLMDTALNGALQVLNSAGVEDKHVDGIEAQLAETAIRNAAQKALSETQKDPEALLKAGKKIENAAGGAELLVKLGDAIKPGVMGPNDDDAKQDLVPVRAEPVMDDEPINQDEFNRMLQNALRRRNTNSP